MLNAADRELQYRVARNAAMLLGKNAQESERICSEVRDLYDKRSKLVHTGQSKDELMDILNRRGFGQRSWKNMEE
jgi:hypothetical protein